ncbi:MAG: hypothetical protein R2864_04995 [Syntrophotaleaceae bacterium]
MIYALDPSQPVFIDGRADMYGEELFKEYRKVVAIDKDIDTILEKHDVRWVVYPNDTPLVRYLLAGNRWKQIYQDEEASVLLRNPTPRP